jgi:hypothetical protein
MSLEGVLLVSISFLTGCLAYHFAHSAGELKGWRRGYKDSLRDVFYDLSDMTGDNEILHQYEKYLKSKQTNQPQVRSEG